MIRLERGTVRSIIDPFNGGIERNVADLRALLKQMAGLDAELQPSYYSPISSRDTLIRLLNNIKLRALSGNDSERAAEIMDRMLLIAPQRLPLITGSRRVLCGHWQSASCGDRPGRIPGAVHKRSPAPGGRDTVASGPLAA